MGQLLVRQVDDADIARLKARARRRSVSVEALVREAIHKAAQLTVEERVQLAREMLARGAAAQVAGTIQTPGWVLIREDRDSDH